MSILSQSSSQKDKKKIAINSFVLLLISSILLGCFLLYHPSSANEESLQSVSENDAALQDIVNPFDSDCYDWRGKNIPCDFNKSYAELLLDKSNIDSRFTDNKDGTVTDNLTKLVWLKNMNCFGLRDLQSAILDAKSLKAGDCGPDPNFILSDGSTAGDWRLPKMKELCTLIDFSNRDPALPYGHMFSDAPPGYHWSSTTLDYHPEMAWIVYFESGTTCYENVKYRAGYVLPVRMLEE